MPAYRAPVADCRFLLTHWAGLDRIAATPRFADAAGGAAFDILAAAARLAEEVLAPLNRTGDRHPARLDNGIVRTPPGFAEAHRALAAGGWIGLTAAPEHGGLGLPQVLATAFHDMAAGACMALHNLPLLTMGQIHALERHAAPELRAMVVPRLISGDWTGTMNLTEAQAGSDVGALRTRAEPAADGSFRITGEKIYITWGDHDFGGNVCHLVLARLPGAPAGTKGISLFLVPKLLPRPDGAPGERNSLRVLRLEDKLGLHGSPTAVMSYEGATGWIIGPPGGGMAAMFTMMNAARLGVAAQGVGIAEAATQAALDHATTRVQGGTGPIADHPDVRRMLATLRAETFAARAIALACAAAIDMAEATGDTAAAARAGLLTPVAKAFCTDTGTEAAQLAIQTFGGAGYIEETGVAQYLRDVRVAQIYEGTNGIQAMDLTGRKLSDGGEAALRLLDDVADEAEAARGALPDLALGLWNAAEALRETTEWLVTRPAADRAAGATAYLRALARVLGGAAHLRAATVDPAGRLPLAAFYLRRLLPEHLALIAQVRAGGEDVMAVTPAHLAA